MKNKRLLWQIFIPFVLVILAALVSVTFYMSGKLREFHLDQIRQQLTAQAFFAEELLAGSLVNERKEYLNTVAKQLGHKTGTRITIIAPDGQVISESHEQVEEMASHADRPEIISALNGETGRAIRPSSTLGQDMIYVAVPIRYEGQIIGVVRTSVSAASIDETLRDLSGQIAIASVVIALAAAMVSLMISRRITRPLQELRIGADRFAQGDFSHTLPHVDSYEIDSLATAMNRMAAELDDRIRTIVRQRNEHEAILSSMAEAVIAVDNQQKIISINGAAEKLLGIQNSSPHGKLLTEIVRNAALHEFIETSLTTGSQVEGQLVLYDTGLERHLRIQGTVLRDAQQKQIGAVVVLNDTTQIRRLERVRKDFVANVSHELKTPVTSIKGFIETLLDGALNDPDNAVRFIKIIERQTNRLNQIIEDLLTLSRIEEQAEKTTIDFERTNIRSLLSAASQLCQLKAAEKDVRILLNCPDGLSVKVSPSLLEQAVVNLVDNAIKYSPENAEVRIAAEEKEGQLFISVADQGCGINEKNLPRLFERFYRVDKARSRKLGGTGLGLAIVKHIAQAHGGSVTVVSEPGHGSEFTIILPAE